MVVARVSGRGTGELLFNGGRILVLRDEEFWRGVGVMATLQGECA